MRLVVIRHAEAIQPGTVPDAERPLSPKGVRVFTAAAHGLARLVAAPDALLTSPLLRARQTAALAAAAWGVQVEAEPALASGHLERILAALERQPSGGTVAVVGHEPTVSALVAELSGMASTDGVGFEPGAAALLEVDALFAHDARVVWHLSPAAAARAAP